MYEVRVYNSVGKLKKVISVNALKIRGEEQIQSPAMFRKRQTNVKPPPKAPAFSKLSKIEKKS